MKQSGRRLHNVANQGWEFADYISYRKQMRGNSKKSSSRTLSKTTRKFIKQMTLKEIKDLG